ncbi:MAG: transglutaminase N-terminal domain-containing protein [Geminicoccaceae bacterium]
MNYRVRHLSRFRYGQPVNLSHHLVHLRPRHVAHQVCRTHELRVAPRPARLREERDPFDNPVARLTVDAPHDALEIEAISVIEVTAPARPERPETTWPWDGVHARAMADLTPDGLAIYQYAFDSRYTSTTAFSELSAFTAESFPPGRPLLDAAIELMGRVHAAFVYDSEATDTETTLDEVLSKKRGVCQDFAHLQIACLRALGLPARYVSGYLLTHPPEGKPRLVGADASHAWLSVWVPDVGWVDLDPTNNVIPGDEHITLAYGRDYGDVSPVRGVMIGGGAHEVGVEVDVMPLDVDRPADTGKGTRPDTDMEA